MRFVFLLIAISMIAWMATAVVPEVPHPKAKAVEHSLTGVAHPKAKAVDPAAAAPEAPITGEPIVSVDPAGAVPGVAPLVPTGPVTPAEEKADSVLSCVNGCNGAVACQTACIYSGYNVPSAPPAGVPPPMVPTPLPSGATPVPSSAGAAAPTGATVQGSSASKRSPWHVPFALVALALSTLFFMA